MGKRKGTITVIAEYKRKLDKGGFIDEILDPDIMSSSFREYGATAMAVMTDERMGGCTYSDLKLVKKEQETAIGQSAVAGADAILLHLDAIDSADELFQAAKSMGLDVIVSVSNESQMDQAMNMGAKILCISGTTEEKISLLSHVPDGICTIGLVSQLEGMEEVEEAWILRDKGFNGVWASDCLFKYGQDVGEHPGAIIRSMKSKSSVKYASPKAMSGRGEGATEYLGDLLM